MKKLKLLCTAKLTKTLISQKLKRIRRKRVQIRNPRYFGYRQPHSGYRPQTSVKDVKHRSLRIVLG